MAKLIFLLVIPLWIASCQPHHYAVPKNVNSSTNDTNKDLYVIRAMVYQVGILTNASDYQELENDTHPGALEALTFYHKNGTNVDLSSIPQPLLTNITGQNFVGVAPVSTANDDEKQFNWAAEKPGTIYSAKGNVRSPRGTEDDNDETETTTDYDSNEYLKPPQVPDGNDKHFLGPWIERTLRKRGTKEETDTEKFIKVVDGNAVIPQGAGIQSVALPPLLSLNNNFSDIPVPIPNTSIIHYARVNTLIKSANSTS